MRLRLSLLATLALLCGASPAMAQVGSCNVVESRLAEREVINGVPLVRLEGPFLVRCDGGAEIRALTGTLNQLTSEIVLVGDVFFQDPDRTLTADRATYSYRLSRLHAFGNVVFINRAEGSTLRGPELEYYRETEERPQTLVVAVQRPHLTLVPRDAEEDAEPLELDGDSITITGRDQLTAVGDVVITQTDIRAVGEEAYYDGLTEDLDLIGAATVTGERFALAGDTIHVDIAESSIQLVHAASEAVLTGEDLEVTAPDLQLFFAADSLQRLVARGVLPDSVTAPEDRPVAVSDAFRLEADSLDALLPGQQLKEVIAIGNARGEALDTVAPLAIPQIGDSTATRLAAVPAILENDWVVGDTIIGYFARVDTADVPTDSADVQLTRLVASGFAQALYRAAPEEAENDEPADAPPGVNYLSGKVIELNFAEGELHLAVVTSLRKGLYLEPLPTVEQVPADSATSGSALAAAGGGTR